MLLEIGLFQKKKNKQKTKQKNNNKKEIKIA